MTELDQIKEWMKKTEGMPLEEMAAFFEKRTESYEEKMSPWKAYYEWIGELVPKDAQMLLDLGCGTGLELEQIYRGHPDVNVTGIDLSSAMLDKLREKYKDKEPVLVCGDYFTVPFEQQAYDVAVTFETLHHFKKEEKVHIFKKIYQALKPGGCYIHGDYIAESEEMESYLFLECSKRRMACGIPDGVFVHFDTPLTLGHEMEALWEAGFSEVELLGYRGRKNTPIFLAKA